MIDLAKKLTRKGDEFIKKKGLKEFHLYAADLLRDSNFHKKYDFRELATSVFSSRAHQNYPHLEFSDLPQTLSWGEHCFLDVYFWRRRPTMIHNHHFNGAFMCLEGNNVDLEFTFKKTKKLGKFHDLGVVTLKHQRRILPGDVAPIDLLDRFIHQNHHQSDLTVNLCFRTPELQKNNISSYLFSGLRSEKNSGMLTRVQKLRRLLDLGPVNVKELSLSDDDALYFLTQFHGIETQNKQLNTCLKHLHQRVKKDLGVDVGKLLRDHDKSFEALENEYE